MDYRRVTVLQHLDYHSWATGQILDAVEHLSEEQLRRNLDNSFGGIWGTLEHIYKADSVWLKRQRGDTSAKLDEADAVSNLADLRGKWTAVQSALRQLAGTFGEDDWERPVEYRFMSGEAASSPVYENLLHVVNHGTYHRGQIVTMLRQVGGQPVSTDLIRYVRLKASRPS